MTAPLDLDALHALALAAIPGVPDDHIEPTGRWGAWFNMHGDPFVAEIDGAGNNRKGFGHVATVTTAPADYGRARAEFIGAADPATILQLIADVVHWKQVATEFFNACVDADIDTVAESAAFDYYDEIPEIRTFHTESETMTTTSTTGTTTSSQADRGGIPPTIRTGVDLADDEPIQHDPPPVAFVDCETTGLDAWHHEIWECALITPDGTRHTWQLPVDLGRAEPIALKISGFHERRAAPSNQTPLGMFATEFAWRTRGLHLVGAVVSFDEERLRALLRTNGACPEWHYHIIDVEALAVGFIRGRAEPGNREVLLPWKSEELSWRIGVDPTQFDKHTALGDALWAQAIYERIMG